MADRPEKETFGWSIYALSLIFLGIVIGIMLISIAWRYELDAYEQNFTREFSKIGRVLMRNIEASHGIIDNLTFFARVNPIFDERVFLSVAEELLDQYPLIEGFLYLHHEHTQSRFILDHHSAIFRNLEAEVGVRNLHENANFKLAEESALVSEQDYAILSTVELVGEKYYVLSKALLNKNKDADRPVQGMVFLMAKIEKLIESFDFPKAFKVDIYGQSSLGNRALLFSQVPSSDRREAIKVSSFSKDMVLPLPAYSIELKATQNIFWKDLRHGLIYIAMLISLIVAVLIFALVRAMNLHGKELQKSNILIEAKVKEQTKELALARDKALEGSRIKSDFVASMSHEIRTPLTIILGMAELLTETKLDKDQSEYVSTFRKAGDTLLGLLDNILDFSKIEANQLILKKIPLNVLDIIEASLEMHTFKAAEHNVELTCLVDQRSNMHRIGDPERLGEIIFNLLSNAIKFTEEGYVVVRVRDAESGGLLISVSDTGMGISEDKRQEIFLSFVQADRSTVIKHGGTGLGLAICMRLIQMMDGDIWVDSAKGVGSTFSFTINLPVNHSSPKIIPDYRQFLQDKHVIIVDDNLYNRSKICGVLATFDAQCTELGELIFHNKLHDHYNTPSSWDYLFLNYQYLLKCSDEEVIALRKLLDGVVIIAMLHPSSLHSQISRIKELGLDDYLVKPIRQSKLLDVFSGEKTEFSAPDEQRQAEEHKTLAKKKQILLVEDNVDNRFLIKKYLDGLPYELDEAENGEIAVNLYRENEYHLIIMDIEMPVMNGHVATRLIRTCEAESERSLTPIIALTAHLIKEELDKCVAAGCDAYIGKPIKKSLLLHLIQKHII